MTTVLGPRPLTVVTGALGSGKTTLLRRLLRDPVLRDTAVLVNELGEVGLDHLQLRQVNERTVVLPGGCVCCTTRSDVTAALGDLLDAEAAFEAPRVRRVVLETTGVADPAPIVGTVLHSPVLRHHFFVDRIVVTVDAQATARTPEQGPEWLQQVVCADLLVLTKTDSVPASAVRALSERLIALNPAAVLALAAEVDLAAEQAPGHRTTRTPAMPSGDHLAGVATASGELAQPVDWAAFAVWLSALLQAHGDRVLRVKAVLDTGAGRPVVVDGVQHVVHPPRHLARWDGPPTSSVVLITRDLPPADVLDALRRFLERF